MGHEAGVASPEKLNAVPLLTAGIQWQDSHARVDGFEC